MWTPAKLVPAFVLLVGCHPPFVVAPGIRACNKSPDLSRGAPPAPDPSDYAGWTSRGELAQPSQLVRCGAPSTALAHLRGGALARPYPKGEPGKLAQLGGNYWIAGYDIGSVHPCYLDTGGPGDHRMAAGTLISPKLEAGARHVSVLVGGGGGRGTRVSLCRDDDRACAPLPGSERLGPGALGMERKAWDLAALGVEGQSVRVRIDVDPAVEPNVGLDFLLIDDLRSGASPAEPRPARLWGFVDLHAHLFNNLGSGGRLLHGDVFARCDPEREKKTCDDPIAMMERALGTSCTVDHGHAGMTFSVEPIYHGTRGAPDFADWPIYHSISHQQAYVDWIERAYRGGLRLVQMDVGNNRTYAAAYEQLNGGIVPPLAEASRRAGDGKLVRSSDEDTVRARELAEARLFVAPGGPAHAWADIAYSASEARRIALDGKLVIVPGVESDNPSDADDVALARANHLPDYQARPVVRAYVERLWREGIRHVFPVHVMPNVFGEPAVYDRTIFCAALPEQGQLEPLADGMKLDIRYHVNRDKGMMGGLVDYLMTDVLDPLPRSVAVKDRNASLGSFAKADCFKLNFLNLKSVGTAVARQVEKNTYDLPSTMGARGLTRVGRLFVEESMRVGMIIDLTHMGDISRRDTIEIAKTYHYPLMASHVNFRELAFGNSETATGSCRFAPPAEAYDPGSDRIKALYGTGVITKVGYEYAVRRDEIDAVVASGGMVGLAFELAGVGVQWAPDGPGAEATPLDCDGTSKSFAQAYRYLRARMKGRGLALGTDVNGFYMLPPPRFGENACAGACEGPLDDDLRCGSGRSGPGNVAQPEPTRVAYGGAIPARQQHAIHQYKVGALGHFDVNVDGVAHYGLLPDFFQDLVNVGVSPEELAALFGGLEDYLEMWSLCEERAKVVRASIP